MNLITEPSPLITDYRTASDRFQLRKILSQYPDYQQYVEVTTDGVTFVNDYLDPVLTLQITPELGDDKEFGPADVLDIISLSPTPFGPRDELEPRVTGQLTHGVVFGSIADGGEAVKLGNRLKQMRDEDLG